MKKSIISALSLAIAASLCMTGVALAGATHPQGQIDIKLTNMSHSVLKLGAHPTHVWGPKNVGVMGVKSSFHAGDKLRHGDSASFLAKFEFDKNIMPTKPYGSGVTFKKAFKDKCGYVYYKSCTVAVKAGPGKVLYFKHGSLCKHLDIKTSHGSGTITYLRAVYN